MHHLSSVVMEDVNILLHGPRRSPGKSTPSSFKKLQAALRQGFCDDLAGTLQGLFLCVDVLLLSSSEELND